MKATLKVEFIGADLHARMNGARTFFNQVAPGLGKKVIGKSNGKPWVAEITGRDPNFKYKRHFLAPNWDYSKANSKGSRGVYLWYVIESGRLYEVSHKVSWSTAEKYFCAVTENGEIYYLNNDEAEEWLSALSA